MAFHGGLTEARIDVDRSVEIGRIDPNIYGHFLESNFFGNIEGGVFDEGSALADDRPGPVNGLRRDVIDLCRHLGLPVVRWPGGNFASPYHFIDGIGPRDTRPARFEPAWGGVETNRFGTDEFLTWCAEVGAEPYLAHSCRDVDEAMRWVEYTNYTGRTELTGRRAATAESYGVRYWGLGNEVYGAWQMGHRSGDRYAEDAAEHARFMRAVDPSIRLIAVGSTDRREEWLTPVLARVGPYADYISFHLYGAATHLYTAAGGDDDYDAVVAQTLYFEREINDYAHLVADLARRAGLERPPGIALDEWNVRHLEPATWPEPRPSDTGGIGDRGDPGLDSAGVPGRLRVNRWSPRTLADVLCYAGVFHVLHRASGLAAPVTMANPVNLVNANGVIVARPGGAVGSAIYHVWDLYQNHTGTFPVRAEVTGPSRTTAVRQGDTRTADGGFVTRPATVPMLDVSATLTGDRRHLHLAVINRHRAEPVTARVSLDGHAGELPPAMVRDLGVDVSDVLAANMLDAPDRVAVRDRGTIHLPDGRYIFPPHSVTVLSFALT